MVSTVAVIILTLLFLAVSIILKFTSKKYPNDFFSLRTTKTLISPEKWKEGNKLFGDMVFKSYLVNTLVVVLLFGMSGASSLLVMYTAGSFSFLMVLAVITTNKKL